MEVTRDVGFRGSAPDWADRETEDRWVDGLRRLREFCYSLIRGRGSIKDPTWEDMMRGKLGYEHLDEPIQILAEAELSVDIIDTRLMQAREILEDFLKHVDESQDFFKKKQLRKLVLLNGTLRDEGSNISGSLSPFNDTLSMKRAKTRRICFKYCGSLCGRILWVAVSAVRNCTHLELVQVQDPISSPRHELEA
ncbi:KH domain-containing protein At4g26480-like [Asparagus officinalis]|uniref:KH domain-containing protein At4g26480-like n=1 Tax=Asparagus officinalis TaxID=4686 RepID=UPI00098E7C33|nr:KH domain-containing protein At4g26480-like [Asparagus officinalis]